MNVRHAIPRRFCAVRKMGFVLDSEQAEQGQEADSQERLPAGRRRY